MTFLTGDEIAAVFKTITWPSELQSSESDDQYLRPMRTMSSGITETPFTGTENQTLELANRPNLTREAISEFPNFYCSKLLSPKS
jgi:hypothetical protein